VRIPPRGGCRVGSDGAAETNVVVASALAHCPVYVFFIPKPSLIFTLMKVVRVQYTLKPGHTEANQQNIAAVVAELKTLNHPGIKYGAWLLPDGKTFMHFDQFENEEAHLALQELASFKKFAAELWAAGFEVEPKLELLSAVASTEEYF